MAADMALFRSLKGGGRVDVGETYHATNSLLYTGITTCMSGDSLGVLHPGVTNLLLQNIGTTNVYVGSITDPSGVEWTTLGTDYMGYIEPGATMMLSLEEKDIKKIHVLTATGETGSLYVWVTGI